MLHLFVLKDEWGFEINPAIHGIQNYLFHFGIFDTILR